MDKKEIKKEFKEKMSKEKTQKDIDIEKISLIRKKYEQKRFNDAKAVLEEYMECKTLLADYDDIVKDCEKKIKIAAKGKATRLKNLEKAIKEFEGKDESNTTDEDRKKFYKNSMEYYKKTAPNRIQPKRKRSRKTKVEILEETRQKIDETRERMKQCEDKMSLYEFENSHEDLMIKKLNDAERRVLNGESWEDIKKETSKKGLFEEVTKNMQNEEDKKVKPPKKPLPKVSNQEKIEDIPQKQESEITEKEEIDNEAVQEEELFKEDEANNEVVQEDEAISSDTSDSEKAEIKDNDLAKSVGSLFDKQDEELMLDRFKDAVREVRELGYSDDEIREYILYRRTRGMDYNRARKLGRLSVLVKEYRGDLEALTEKIFDDPKPFVSFEIRHPRIASIPVLGWIIREISDRRAIRKEMRAAEERAFVDTIINEAYSSNKNVEPEEEPTLEDEVDKEEAFRNAIRRDTPDVTTIRVGRAKNNDEEHVKEK